MWPRLWAATAESFYSSLRDDKVRVLDWVVNLGIEIVHIMSGNN